MTIAEQQNDPFWKRIAIVVVVALLVCAAAWSYNQFSQGRAIQGISDGISDLPNQMAKAGQELQEEFRGEMAKLEFYVDQDADTAGEELYR